MRLVLLAALALAASLGLTPLAAEAQDGPKIVVLDPKGNPAWGGPIVAKALRKKLEAATGSKVSAKDYAKAVKALKLKGAEANEPANIARAGKEAGADFVLALTITKKGWQYTANAVLINTATGEQQMDFKSGYFKPKVEGPDRGERIARVTLEKIAALDKGGSGAVAVAPPPARDKPPAREVTPPPPPPAREERADRVDREDRVAADPPPTARGDRIATEDDPPAASDRIDEPTPAVGARIEEPSATTLARNDTRAPDRDLVGQPEAGAGDDLFHLMVAGGAGVLHTFDLDGENGARSRLSYQLQPLSLVVADLEVLIPMIKSGVFGHMAFSPVRFLTRVGSSETEPSGILMDLAFGLKVHLALTGEGRETVQLVPALGLRLNVLSVGDHPSSLIHGSTSVAPFAGVELRFPFSATFEALAAFDFGLVVGYSETPAQSRDGDLSNGMQLGAGLGLRYWLTDAVGIAFDGRFDLRSLSLEGPSLRQGPPGERLRDVSIGNRDLRFSVGVALRI